MKRKIATGLSGTDGQPRISVFFSPQSSQGKRPRSASPIIDLTHEDSEVEEEPPIKKLKVTKGSSRTDQWRFDNTVERPVSGQDEDKKKRRHEEFKRVLLAENSSFSRQRSQQSQEGQSSEDESLQSQDDVSESDAQEEVFKHLTKTFSHKADRTKGKTSLSKHKGEVLGPSGQPYTPAELQASWSTGSMLSFTNILFNPSRWNLSRITRGWF